MNAASPWAWARSQRRWILRAALAAAAVPVLIALIVFALALFEPLPAPLRDGSAKLSLRISDRHGRLVRELATTEGRRSARVSLEDVSPYVLTALLAAEDARFRIHPGVDPLAMLRATWQALSSGRVVSGASTLTQQLARALVPRPRSVWGKLREAAVAVRIEMSLDKDRIITEYLNRIEFGPNLVGVDAASRRYFDKPPSALDLAEAASLVAMVRGPSFYDPRKGTARLERRRNEVLRRVRVRQLLPEALIARAERQTIVVRPPSVHSGAEHFAFAVAEGRATLQAGHALSKLETTLDLPLQRDVEAIARLAMVELAKVSATALSVLVVENATADVLAYVGSPDFFAVDTLGANDGARALRQPGSALKPFVYAAAMERLGWSAATLINDLALELSTPEGRYLPKNYDGREHGPVRLRVALANSLNLPALRATAQVGPEHVLELLHRFGFSSLDRDADHYGVALALGDGEVRLTELAAAYAALARDGEWRPLRFVRAREFADGKRQVLPVPAAARALPGRIARQITSILADERARRPSFGTHSVLALPFPAAAKTGTSKGFRDNWAIGYTREVTVAVWAGNFDGRPMVRSSGLSGAGPVFHAVLERAMRGRSPEPLVRLDGLDEREICPLSGELPTSACPERIREHFSPGTEPRGSCHLHERVTIDRTTGRRAGPGCRGTEIRIAETYPSDLAAWAERAGRPVVSDRVINCSESRL